MSKNPAGSNDWGCVIVKAIEEKAKTSEGRREITERVAKMLAEPIPTQFGQIDWENRFEPFNL